MPTYWVALIIGIITILFLSSRGVELTRLNPQFALPRTWQEWLFPLTLCPLFPAQMLPVPVSNALGIEVGVYALMPLLARHREGAWIAFAIGVGANCFYGFDPGSFLMRYTTLTPCVLAFAVGSRLCHYRPTLSRVRQPILSFIIWVLHGLLWLKFPIYPWTWGIYVSLLLSAWVVISLADVRSTKTDTLMGDLSYPVYLLHTTVAAWFLPVFGYERRTRFFVIAFLATLVLSYVISVIFEAPLKKFKTRRGTRDIPEIVSA